jgi:hypothetical protein
MSKNSIIIYSDGGSFLYKPVDIYGFLLLNYNKNLNQLYYKFFNKDIDNTVIKIKDNKQTSLNIYNMFYKNIIEQGEIEVLDLSEFNEDDILEESDTQELEDFFGFKYYEETDIHIVNSLIKFHID